MTIRVLLLIAVFLNSSFLYSSEIEDIMAKNITVRGGFDKLSSINAIYTEAAVNTAKNSLHYKLFECGKNRLRLEMMIDNKNNVTVINDTTGWVQDPNTGEIVKLDSAELATTKQKVTDQFGIYRNYFVEGLNNGFSARIFKRDTVRGDSIIVIKLHDTNGKYSDRYVYIHKPSGVDYAVYIGNDPEEKLTGTEIYFRKNTPVNGVIIPFEIDIYKRGRKETQMVFSKIELNNPVDSTLFTIPEYKYTADEIYNKCTAAYGGKNVLNDINTVEIKGTMVGGELSQAESDVVNMAFYKRYPDKLRIETTDNGLTNTVVINSRGGWKLDNTDNGQKATRLSSGNLNYLKDIFSTYFDIVDKDFFRLKPGDKILTLAGRVNDEGMTMYSLKYHKDDKTDIYYLIDDKDFLVRRKYYKNKASMGPLEINYEKYEDYGETLLPTILETRVGNTRTRFTIDKINVNDKLDDTLFDIPD